MFLVFYFKHNLCVPVHHIAYKLFYFPHQDWGAVGIIFPFGQEGVNRQKNPYDVDMGILKKMPFDALSFHCFFFFMKKEKIDGIKKELKQVRCILL